MSSPACLAKVIPTEAEKMVKMIWALRPLDGSELGGHIGGLIRRPPDADQLHAHLRDTFASMAWIIGSIHIAFSATMATLDLWILSSFFRIPPNRCQVD